MMPEKPPSPSLQAGPRGAESRRLQRTHMPERSGVIGGSVREADHALGPSGTAYLFPDISALGATDQQAAAELQSQARVLVSPGYQFGSRDIGHFWLCYARDRAHWSVALYRIVASQARIGMRDDSHAPGQPGHG
jgi:aspartate/methionine/tyrosine aminotransferase